MLEQLLKEKKGKVGRTNFELITELGEGTSKKAFLVVGRKGSPNSATRYVLKVLKPQLKTGSIQHTINQTKDAGIFKERDILLSLDHPNIVGIQECSPEASLEAYFGGMSLEQMHAIYGPLYNPSIFMMVFSQLFDSLDYIHNIKGIVHRDIKPSNVLIGKGNRVVKLIDFQYAEKCGALEDKLLPTRGSTAYTHPEVINGLITQSPRRMSIATELYSLGATMYFALAGHEPFPYSIVQNSNGVPLKIANKNVLATLYCNNSPIESIDVNMHEDLLERALQKVPDFSHELLRMCLSLTVLSPSHDRVGSAINDIVSFRYPSVEITPYLSSLDDTLYSLSGDHILYNHEMGSLLTQIAQVVQTAGTFKVTHFTDSFEPCFHNKSHYSGNNERFEEYSYFDGTTSFLLKNNYYHDIESSSLVEHNAYWTERHDQTLIIDGKNFHRKLYWKGHDGVKVEPGCGCWEKR